MSTTRQSEQHTARCDALLMEAIKLYNQILDSYSEFQRTFTAMTLDQPEKEMASISHLMDKVQGVDRSIEKTLPDSSSYSHMTQTLLDERTQLLGSLLSANKAINTKTANAKSLIFHELKSMRSNRSAMQGYKNTDIKRSIIRNSV